MFDEIVPLTIFVVIAVIIKILSDNKVRRLAIEKGMVNEDIKYLYFDRFEGKVPSSLKWGFVLIGIGLAILLGRFAFDSSEEFMFGAMFFFAGIGLVIYYFVANKIYKKAKAEEG